MPDDRQAIDPGDLELRAVDGGVRLRLRVKAGGRKNAVLGTHAGALRVSVTTAPEKGKANRAVLALLGKALGLPASAIELVAGPTSPDKTVLVPLSPREVFSRLGGGS
jgi:uncharacterized protein (TIGR00251 family)